jgi:putative hydrolase
MLERGVDTNSQEPDHTRRVAFNSLVAEKLDEIARILRLQGANKFRVAAYDRAAEMIRNMDTSIEPIVRDEGIMGLEALPTIGRTIARLIYQLVTTGHIPMLDRLRGLVDPVTALTSIPGIGVKSARMLHDALGITSLEELEIAAYDGRLAELGLGPKRIQGIRDSLVRRLGGPHREATVAPSEQPPVAELLSVDREYREKAAAGELYLITPRRFNPGHRAWLPVLHTSRGEHHYTVLFSNSPRAHEAEKTSEWVVIYFETDHKQRQYTVVNSTHGILAGQRVVRGREKECFEYYELSRGAPDEGQG